jgi:hypothetical protein
LCQLGGTCLVSVMTSTDLIQMPCQVGFWIYDQENNTLINIIFVKSKIKFYNLIENVLCHTYKLLIIAITELTKYKHYYIFLGKVWSENT